MSDIRNYYQKNFLYESHRIIPPELRDKINHTCSECKFYVMIVGRHETRPGCAAVIPQYANLTRRVPEKLDIVDVLRAVGREGLERVINVEPEREACGRFGAKR